MVFVDQQLFSQRVVAYLGAVAVSGENVEDGEAERAAAPLIHGYASDEFVSKARFDVERVGTGQPGMRATVLEGNKSVVRLEKRFHKLDIYFVAFENRNDERDAKQEEWGNFLDVAGIKA